ncbi:putative NADH dehydrogenase [ubiquinone] iron-sulfur protein 6 [Blattella germanica]|nr:putative NADH dehydrogenase [ubiquinone] iron-sulfur protein 6 [Blattella germanica]
MALLGVRNYSFVLKEIQLLQNCKGLTGVSCTRLISNRREEDTEIHTGQKWDKNDYRLVRFVGRPKQVNPHFAIKLIDEVPPAEKEERVVWCDGGGGPTGHPKVYINLDKPGNHACGYCGLRFTKEDHHH